MADMLAFASVVLIGLLFIGVAHYHRTQRAATRITVQPPLTWNSSGEALVEVDCE